jgi:twitching motility protein PilU
LGYADSANDLRLMIKLDQETDATHLTGQASKLSIQGTDDY